MTGEEEEQFEAGRALVRKLLVNRLSEAGLKPCRGNGAEAHGLSLIHI